ncbi:hypothetical protein EYF80_043953 [Liparis tanakae]|uniref:Uncharacterized protein n=1 Tax=Liparis tanakae TaxID=230148 RepID=A0A4Z2FX03_9TELE|nr:hypothetical protein EYF80_043953 [Liparis tanakae]
MTGGNVRRRRRNGIELHEGRLVESVAPGGTRSGASPRRGVPASHTAGSTRQSLSLMLTCSSSGGGCHLSGSVCSGSSDQWGIEGLSLRSPSPPPALGLGRGS